MSLSTQASSSDAPSFSKRMLSFVQNPQVIKTALIGSGAGFIAASSISLLTGASLALTGAFAWSIVGSVAAVAARAICKSLSSSNQSTFSKRSFQRQDEEACVTVINIDPGLMEFRFDSFDIEVDFWKSIAIASDTKNEKNIQDAADRIKQCYKENSKDLDLSELKLKSLPEQIYKLKSLKTLNLDWNKLSVLPGKMGELTSLEKLDLSWNNLTLFPKEVTHLKKLRSLDLWGNRIAELPPEISKLGNLRVLDLTLNHLTCIPSVIAQLSQLEKINISDNLLSAIPEEMSDLTNLREIDFSLNEIREIPTRIFQLRNLEKLSLKHNQLNSLPLETFNLPATCTVSIENNRFTEATIRRLHNTANTQGYSGPRFRFNMASDNLEFDYDIGHILGKIEALAGVKIDTTDLQAAIPDESQRPFRIWVNKLFWTADGKSESDRAKAYFTDVANILNKANEDKSYRDDVFMPCMFEGYESCGDRIALSIIHMGLRKQILDTDPKDVKKMCDLLVKGEYALALLEEIATDKIKTLAAVDELEVHLGFLCRLKDPLDLPINLENMLYFACSCIKEDDLQNSKAKLEKKLKLESAIPGFLAKNATWHNTLIALKAEEMKEIENEAESAYEVDPGMSADPEMIEKKRGDGIAKLTWELLK